MEFADVPSASKQIRSLGWRFQKTFLTPPPKQLDPYVDVIVSIGRPRTACITIDQAVFEPKEWISVLTRNSLEPRYKSGVAVTCSGEHEVRELLVATFGGWFDFVYVPSPKRFVIYADHDDYTTFYASTKSNLNSVVTEMLGLGVKEIEYERYF
jgi:hypothetical protein